VACEYCCVAMVSHERFCTASARRLGCGLLCTASTGRLGWGLLCTASTGRLGWGLLQVRNWNQKLYHNPLSSKVALNQEISKRGNLITFLEVFLSYNNSEVRFKAHISSRFLVSMTAPWQLRVGRSSSKNLGMKRTPAELGAYPFSVPSTFSCPFCLLTLC